MFLAFITNADSPYGLLQIVKLDCDDSESGKHWPHLKLMVIMNKEPNIMQIQPVTKDNEAVFIAKFILIPLFLDDTPKKALSMFQHVYDVFHE